MSLGLDLLGTLQFIGGFLLAGLLWIIVLLSRILDKLNKGNKK